MTIKQVYHQLDKAEIKAAGIDVAAAISAGKPADPVVISKHRNGRRAKRDPRRAKR